MKLYDVLPATGGIFQTMNALHPFPWADTISPEQMDFAYRETYTNKPFTRFVARMLNDADTLTPENITSIARLLDVMFYDKWVRAYNLFISGNKAFGNGYTETITETIHHENETTNNGTTTTQGTQEGKVSGFNSTDYQDKDQTTNDSTQTQEGTGTDTGDQTRDYTRTGYGEYYADTYKKSLDALQSYLMCDIIFVDANSILALHIYD